MNPEEKFLNLVKNADDDDLMMSIRNCHISGVDSIVLKKNEDGTLFRAFICHHDHGLDLNKLEGSWPVGFHNHKYDITLDLIFGRVTNFIGKEFPDEPLSSQKMSKYVFRSNIQNRSFTTDSQSHFAQFKIIKESLLKLGKPLHLDHETIHTVHVPYGDTAAWYVTEGRQKKDHTILYKKRSTSLNSNNLYIKFDNADHVRRVVDSFVKNRHDVPF